MTQYIDKDALVAEIKRRIDCCYKMCAGNLDFLQKAYPERYYSIETYKEILSFINSLEVKEVDINKEISQFIDANFEKAKIGHKLSLRRTAKYFFELGMSVNNKAQKGK